VTNVRRHVVVVGGNDSSLSETSGLDVDFTLLQLPERISRTQIDHCVRAALFDFTCVDALTAFGCAINRIQPVTAVVSFWEKGLLPAARLAESLGVRGNPVAPVANSRDKLRFRQLTADLCPIEFAAVDDADAAAAFLRAIGAPIIIKPRCGSGSAGVTLATDEEEARGGFAAAVEVKAGPVLAERYIEGPEYSVETLSLSGTHNVLGVTRKTTNGPPHFIEVAHEFPAPEAASCVAALTATTLQMLDRLSHRDGPAHTELRLSKDGPALMETQTRFGGDQIWEMVKLTTGVSLARATVGHLTGIAVSPRAIEAPAAAVGFFARERCRVDHVEGIEAAAELPGIVRVTCSLRVGQQLGPLRRSADRQGYILATADSPRCARERVERAMSRIRIDVS
jgi:biotin carboxylase